MRKTLLFIVLAALCLPTISYCENTGALTVRQAEDFPFDPQRKHDGDFVPTESFTKISKNLYCLEDCCNVFIVKHGKSAPHLSTSEAELS